MADNTNLTDTKYQRAKIIAEETRRFYFQIIFTLGIFIVILVRGLFINRSSFDMASIMSSMGYANANISSVSPNISFMTSPYFIFSYLGVVFIILLGYRYLKLYLLKRSFENQESGIKKLKKYMKTDEIPTNEEVHDKFNKDKDKQKRKFYLLVLRVIAFNVLLYYIYSNFLGIGFLFEIILAFSIITLIYRYLIIFHADKKFLGKDWENKKIKEYLKNYNI